MKSKLWAVAVLSVAFTGVNKGYADETCVKEKFAFDTNAHAYISQATACYNDSSLEFCLPRGDDLIKNKVVADFPNVVCSPGNYRGRVGCIPSSQILCLYRISKPVDCLNESSMSTSAWEKVCRLSQIEAIKKIAATWLAH